MRNLFIWLNSTNIDQRTQNKNNNTEHILFRAKNKANRSVFARFCFATNSSVLTHTVPNNLLLPLHNTEDSYTSSSSPFLTGS